MNQLLRTLKYARPVHLKNFEKIFKRTFLSPAYNCNDSWNQRFSSPILERVNINDLYYELDQRFQKTGAISAVDVDIFANKVQDEIHVEELLDLVYKLRLSFETTNMLDSTATAVIRYLMDLNKKEDLLNVIDDRLNYGIFLDYHSANLLMNKFNQEKDFVAGCRIASQLMLQDELENPISLALGLMHCYNFLQKPAGWPEQIVPESPEEEVKIRVKYLRNPYNDQHFDLKDGLQIVGKTLIYFTKGKTDPLNQSFHLLGLALFEQENKFKDFLSKVNGQLYSEVLNLLPDENPLKKELDNVKVQSGEVQTLLAENIKQAISQKSEADIADQSKLYTQWIEDRKNALDGQIERLDTARRIDNIKKTQEELKSREEKLWFFKNEEDIELAIENKKVYYPKRWFGKKKKPRKIDEGYIPPEL